jgi:hypothetical protein
VWSGRAGWFRLSHGARTAAAAAFVEHLLVVERGIVRPTPSGRWNERGAFRGAAGRRQAAVRPLAYRFRPPHRGEIVAYVEADRERGSCRPSHGPAPGSWDGSSRCLGTGGSAQRPALFERTLQDGPTGWARGAGALPRQGFSRYHFILGDNRAIPPRNTRLGSSAPRGSAAGSPTGAG